MLLNKGKKGNLAKGTVVIQTLGTRQQRCSDVPLASSTNHIKL